MLCKMIKHMLKKCHIDIQEIIEFVLVKKPF